MKINFTKKFRRKYAKLRKQVRDKFEDRLRLFVLDQYNPLLNNHPLKSKYKGSYSINVTGNIRAIYEFVAEDTLYFIDIDTHPKLYE